MREKRGLAYAVGSYSEQYVDCGMVATYVGTREENVREACEIIGRELERFAITGSRRGAGTGQGARQRPAGAGAGGDRGAHVAARPGDPVRRPAAFARRDARADRAVSADDVAELATELYDPERLSAACIGPNEERFREAAAAVSEALAVYMIRVAVSGAAGRMGAAVCEAVEAADDLELAGRADPALDVQLSEVLEGARRGGRLHDARGRAPRTFASASRPESTPSSAPPGSTSTRSRDAEARRGTAAPNCSSPPTSRSARC